MPSQLPPNYRPVGSCPNCEKSVSILVQGECEGPSDEFRPERTDLHLLGSCPYCLSPFLLLVVGYVDPYGTSMQWKEPIILYPVTEKSMDISIPVPLANSYLEAARSYEVRCYTASAIMCRRVLDGVCSHFEGGSGSLARNLSVLKDKAILDPRLYEWSDEVLRNLGNEAAHDVNKTISQDDAKDALDFTKALLEYLFVFAVAFQKFKERRSVSKDQPTGIEGQLTPSTVVVR